MKTWVSFSFAFSFPLAAGKVVSGRGIGCLSGRSRGYLLRSMRPARWFFLSGCAGLRSRDAVSRSAAFEKAGETFTRFAC